MNYGHYTYTDKHYRTYHLANAYEYDKLIEAERMGYGFSVDLSGYVTVYSGSIITSGTSLNGFPLTSYGTPGTNMWSIKPKERNKLLCLIK